MNPFKLVKIVFLKPIGPWENTDESAEMAAKSVDFDRIDAILGVIEANTSKPKSKEPPKWFWKP